MLLTVAMWKKRFLPYSYDDKTSSPQPKISSELNNSQGQDAQLQQHHCRQLPPDAHHNLKVRLFSLTQALIKIKIVIAAFVQLRRGGS